MQVQMSGCIYKITAPNGRNYIGQNSSRVTAALNARNGQVKLGLSVYGLKNRLKQHRSKSSNCTLLKRSISKYGLDNMKVEVLLRCSVDYLDFYERQMIQAWNALAPTGLNCTTGGEEGKALSQETRKNISLAMQSYYKEHDNAMKGKPGHMKGKPGHMKGKSHTEETKAKISISLTGRQVEKKRQAANGCVGWHKASKKYQAIIPSSWTQGKKNKALGLYDTKEEARAALAEYKSVHICAAF
jgi:group I intron endonuclease